MQRVDAVDDLLERAVWNDPREDRVHGEDGRIGIGLQVAASPECRGQRFVWRYARVVSARSKHPAQLVGVPSGSRAEDQNLHQLP
jgi:hypothetical protein